jgi:hypothetical protein
MKRITPLVAAVLIFLTACTTVTPAAPEPTVTPTIPPSATPLPQPTATPGPQPLTFSGNGDSEADLSAKWEGPAILHITYSGGGNFIVSTLDAGGINTGLIINITGSSRYDGTVPLDFTAGAATMKLRIKASGAWTVEVFPLVREYLHVLTLPGRYEGMGDDVIYFDGEPASGTFNAPPGGLFAVFAYADRRVELINTNKPYSGQVEFPPGTILIVVNSAFEWTLEATKR